MTLSMAAGYLDQRAGCQVTIGRDTEVLVVALALAANPAEDGLTDVVSADSLAQARSRLDEAAADQAAWFRAGVSDLRCPPAS